LAFGLVGAHAEPGWVFGLEGERVERGQCVAAEGGGRAALAGVFEMGEGVELFGDVGV